MYTGNILFICNNADMRTYGMDCKSWKYFTLQNRYDSIIYVTNTVINLKIYIVK